MNFLASTYYFIQHHIWYLTLHNGQAMGMKQQLTKCSEIIKTLKEQYMQATQNSPSRDLNIYLF